jgi:hypothetical protein
MALKDWSSTAASNTNILSGITLDGSTMTPSQVDDAFREMAAQLASQMGLVGAEGADIASAATVNLASATGWAIDVTGTTTITAFGTVDAGKPFLLRFTGILTLTHNATSLILPGSANITTAANDVMILKSEGSGNWRCMGYQRADGRALVKPSELPSSSTDNTLPRFDGTTGALQTSGVTVDDSNNVSGIGTLTVDGATQINAALTAVSFSGDNAGSNVIIASADGAGTINFRPKGVASSTDAMSIDNSGNVSIRGDVTVDGGAGKVSAMNSAKAWVNFNGTGTPAIADSFNVSSITDNGTGDYTINFTTAMANANYAAVASGMDGTLPRWAAAYTKTTSGVTVLTHNGSGSLDDFTQVDVVAFGD